MLIRGVFIILKRILDQDSQRERERESACDGRTAQQGEKKKMLLARIWRLDGADERRRSETRRGRRGRYSSKVRTIPER